MADPHIPQTEVDPFNNSEKVHLSRPSIVTCTIPTLRTFRNGSKIPIPERTHWLFETHPDRDDVFIVRTENNDEYIFRLDNVLTSIRNVSRSARRNEPIK